MKGFIGVCCAVVLTLVAPQIRADEWDYDRILSGGEPFVGGVAYARYGGPLTGKLAERKRGDLRPTIMYDPDSGDGKPYKMWWFCGYNSEDLNDIDFPDGLDSSHDLITTDRVCFAWSASPIGPWQSDASSASGYIVLKPRGKREDGRVSKGDDHLLGSPTVFQVDCKIANCPTDIPHNRFNKLYVMLYEGYGNWMAKINRFWNSWARDTFVTGDSPALTADVIDNNKVVSRIVLPDQRKYNENEDMLETTNTSSRKLMGYAPRYVKPGTQPVYSCVVYYGAKENRYLSLNGCAQPDGSDLYGFHWHDLGIDWVYGIKKGTAVFWTYNTGGTDRTMLYRCYDTILQNTFETLESDCEKVRGALPDGNLGYVSVGWTDDKDPNDSTKVGPGLIPAADMIGANQNRIHMAYSNDGVHWVRFEGADPSGAVILPQDLKAIKRDPCPTFNANPKNIKNNPWYNPFSFHFTYGAGFPKAFIRDDYVEVWFYDETRADTDDEKLCRYPSIKDYRVRIPIAQLFTASTWVDISKVASRWSAGTIGIYDVKWSPDARRYFALTVASIGEKKVKNVDGVEEINPDYQQTPVLVWSAIDPPTTGNVPMYREDLASLYHFNCPDKDENVVDRMATCPPTNVNNTTKGRVGYYGGIMGDVNGHVRYQLKNLKFHIYYPATPIGLLDVTDQMNLDYLYIFGKPSYK